MTQPPQQWVQPPPQPQQQQQWMPGSPPASGPKKKSGIQPTTIVVVLACVALVAGGVIGGLMSGSGKPEPETIVAPTPTVEPTTEPTTETDVSVPQPTDPLPTDPPPTTAPPTFDPDPDTLPDPHPEWGTYPPANIDSLKDLSMPFFPEVRGDHTLDGVHMTNETMVAIYRGINNDDVSITVDFDQTSYSTFIGVQEGPTYYGNAVCGKELISEMHSCVMAGTAQTVTVLGHPLVIEMDELARFANELYAEF